MPFLYVGNATRQTQRVYYRLDFTNEGELIVGAKHVAAKWNDIPSGRQIPLSNRDLPIEAVNDIVNQLNEYGMVGVVDAQRNDLPSRSTVPYVFNIGAPIPANVLQKVFDHNRGVLANAGKLLRQKAAIAGSEIVAQAVAEAAATSGVQIREHNVFEMEVEQEESVAETSSIAEGYRVEKVPEQKSKPRTMKRAAT